MASPLEPPRAPAPPAPPRSSSTVVAIVLCLLALIVLVSVAAVWTGLRFLSQGVQVQVNDRGGRKKDVLVKVPFASVEVHRDVNEASLGLPVYPGAKSIPSDENATVDLEFGGEEGVRILVGKFETPDPLEKVKAFYQERLGHEVTKTLDKDSRGKTVFEIKKAGNERIVALKGGPLGTLIELVRVQEGAGETN